MNNYYELIKQCDTAVQCDTSVMRGDTFDTVQLKNEDFQLKLTRSMSGFIMRVELSFKVGQAKRWKCWHGWSSYQDDWNDAMELFNASLTQRDRMLRKERDAHSQAIKDLTHWTL